MAMTMTGQVMLPADRAKVWAALNDPRILQRSIPGCQELAKVGDTEFTATAKVAVGSVKATFKARWRSPISIRRTDTRSPAKGRVGVAGFAKGGAKVHLEDGEGGGTLLSYDVEAHVGGKLAQLGGRLINGVAKKNADEFFDNFAKSLAPAELAP